MLVTFDRNVVAALAGGGRRHPPCGETAPLAGRGGPTRQVLPAREEALAALARTGVAKFDSKTAEEYARRVGARLPAQPCLGGAECSAGSTRGRGPHRRGVRSVAIRAEERRNDQQVDRDLGTFIRPHAIRHNGRTSRDATESRRHGRGFPAAMLHLAHRRFARSVDPFADGELDAHAAWMFAHHLLECEDCHHDLAMVRAIKHSLHRLAAAEPPGLAPTRLRRWADNLEE